MRKNNRILKILEARFPFITFISNSGEYRKVDLKKLFNKLKYKEGDFGYEVITDKNIFKSVEIIDKALAWKNLTQTLQLPNGDSLELFFHLDPIVTIKNSIIDEKRSKSINHGKSIRALRKYLLHISQEELGERIGSDKQYISKIENYRTDLELKTLRKIYEVGLNKNIFIAHYDKEDLLKSFTNSILNIKFIAWADKNKSDLNLIEGIGHRTKLFLAKNSIKSTEDLSKMRIKDLFDLISQKHSLSFYHHPDTWLVQSKLITNSYWVNLINLQRSISKKKDSDYSKIEDLAKKEIGEALYLVE